MAARTSPCSRSGGAAVGNSGSESNIGSGPLGMGAAVTTTSHIVLARAVGTARSPEEETIELLNVLTSDRAPSVLNAVLSHEFTELRPALATKHRYYALLRHYPGHVLLRNLRCTLSNYTLLGDLTSLSMLWKLVGPTTTGRAVWLKQARAGNAHVLRWARDRGHLGRVLHRHALLVAGANGEILLLEKWIGDQPNAEEAAAKIRRDRAYVWFLGSAPVAALNWWWIHVANACELPLPATFALLVETLLLRDDVSTLDWWWARFLEYRTPMHTFGSMNVAKRNGWKFSLAAADWLWDHSHVSGTHWNHSFEGAFGFASDWNDLALPEHIDWDPDHTKFLVTWWIDKCAIMDRKLTVPSLLVNGYVRAGDLTKLAFLLQRQSKMGQKILKSLENATALDAPDVLDWWLTRFPYSSHLGWNEVARESVKHNARHVQAWLLARPRSFVPSAPFHGLPDTSPTLYTLQFVAEFAPRLLDYAEPFLDALTDPTGVSWQCFHKGINVGSLLPLPPDQWDGVVKSIRAETLEWWLQQHRAGGFTPVLPHASTLFRTDGDMAIPLGSSNCRIGYATLLFRAAFPC
ncbi:hypothetical protein BC828DRAFT_424993 [Blastocladiella britannica]|nr:hypothetical protein BC828DRAFT_424993 [Blastocladiella britannica]